MFNVSVCVLVNHFSRIVCYFIRLLFVYLFVYVCLLLFCDCVFDYVYLVLLINWCTSIRWMPLKNKYIYYPCFKRRTKSETEIYEQRPTTILIGRNEEVYKQQISMKNQHLYNQIVTKRGFMHRAAPCVCHRLKKIKEKKIPKPKAHAHIAQIISPCFLSVVAATLFGLIFTYNSLASFSTVSTHRSRLFLTFPAQFCIKKKIIGLLLKISI